MDLETYDPAMAKRVWQRVHGDTQTSGDGTVLQTLIEEAWEDAHRYRDLSRRHRGRTAAVYVHLHRQTMEHLRLLKGICAVTDHCAAALSPVRPRTEPESIILRRCYGRALQRLNWYATKENDPQFGHILPPMIRQTRQHTQQLLQLMTRPGIK